MTWITDNNGTRWVDVPERKRRKPARALRFAEIKIGDQLMKTWKQSGWRYGRDDRNGPAIELSRATEYYIVTDLWFDPVAGQRDPLKGEMVGIARLLPNGKVADRKEPHTKRGLASQSFHYADIDYIAFVEQRRAAENVVGIGLGRAIQRRPKVPGSRL